MWRTRMKKIILIVCFLLIATTAFARTYKVSYTEPTTNTDGTTLTDLAKCSIYYQIPLGIATKAWDKTATAATGGGIITDQDVVVTVPAGQEEQVDFWGTCSDIVGNESLASSKARLHLTPGFPIGIIVK